MVDVLGRIEDGADGLPSRRAEARMTFIRTPYPLRLAWAPQTVIHRVRCHRAVAPSLSKAFELVLAHYGSPAAVGAAGLDLFGGCYLPGDLLGGLRTLHAYGAAIRLDPEANPPGKPWAEAPAGARGVLSAGELRPMMPLVVVDIFEGLGWRWSGRTAATGSGRPDCAQFGWGA